MRDILSKQQTVLIVDDSMLNIIALTELLKADFSIQCARDGETALKIAFSDHPPDLVLLDVIMPGINGYEVCKRLKKSSQTRHIPVIFVTGKIKEEDEIFGFNLGAADYIVKPFRPVVTRVRVNTHAELKRYHDFLESVSYLDGLTGIANRRKLEEHLEFIWSLTMHKKKPVCAIMIDIDCFKEFNDHYGHQEGDSCLIQIAQTLAENAEKEAAMVARFGGEEFVCVLQNTDSGEAARIAEKLREAVLDLQIRHDYSSVEKFVTISLGVASCVPDELNIHDNLIRLADNALYRSKHLGRNQTSIIKQQYAEDIARQEHC